MNRQSTAENRGDALRRATEHSPFLRDATAARADLVGEFLDRGSVAAVERALATFDDDIDARLRRQRLGLALTVALGDLSGELSLEEVTRLLSDFADRSIDEALTAAIAQRMPGADSRGFAVIAMGKLGSHELNYSS